MGCFETEVHAPKPIDPYEAGKGALQAQADLAPQLYELEAKYRPRYADIDNQILHDSLLGKAGADGTRSGGLVDLYGEIAPRLSQQTADANRMQREADIADVMAMGPQARQAYLAANPELARTMSGLESRIASARPVGERRFDDSKYGQLSPLRIELQRQAMEELTADGGLSAADMRTAQQSARAAGAASGLYDSNVRVGAEILNADSLLRQRRTDARSFADTVDQTAFTQGLQDRAYGLQKWQSEEDLNRALTNDSFAREFALADSYRAQATDPWQAVLGRSGVPAMAQSTAGQGSYALNSSPKLFDPYNSSIMDIYAGNQANELAARTATANNRAGMISGLFQGLGSLGGGLLARG